VAVTINLKEQKDVHHRGTETRRTLRLIGNSGASIISRVMGLILASVAVASVLAGIKEYFAI
jgi:small neutral amino acid transporter SnatA (MarC family)